MRQRHHVRQHDHPDRHLTADSVHALLLSNEVPRDFTGMTPYVATLLVLALAAQRLRMPAADGLRYRRRQSV